MNFSALADITFDPKAKRSINYAKARAAIEQEAKNRHEQRQSKQVVIEHLGGKLEEAWHERTASGIKKHFRVKFPDGSIARY